MWNIEPTHQATPLVQTHFVCVLRTSYGWICSFVLSYEGIPAASIWKLNMLRLSEFVDCGGGATKLGHVVCKHDHFTVGWPAGEFFHSHIQEHAVTAAFKWHHEKALFRPYQSKDD